MFLKVHALFWTFAMFDHTVHWLKNFAFLHSIVYYQWNGMAYYPYNEYYADNIGVARPFVRRPFLGW